MDPATNPAPVRPASLAPRWMRVLLVLSLAFNLLIVGLVVGHAITDGPGRGPRPADMALGPIARALDEGDRRAILESLRGSPGLEPLRRNERDTGLAEISAAVRADPYDEARLRAALAAQGARIESVQKAVQDALVGRLATMSPEARGAFADRLEHERGGH